MMSATEYFEIQATHYAGMAPSVMFLFRKAVRASNVWRFKHKIHSTKLHIFSDVKDLPIAIQFREIELHATESAKPIDAAIFQARMYSFAQLMISYGQLQQGQELIEDAIKDFPNEAPMFEAPELDVVDASIDSARLAFCEAV